jgi:translation initiation factor IF-2
MLASASDAIIIRFNVRPAGNATIADKEEIDIRYYSIIYAAIDERCNGRNVSSEMKEEILGTAELEIFKISKLVLLQVVW